MSTADVVVLVAAVVACLGAIAVSGAVVVLVGQVRRLERGIEALRDEVVPLVQEARAAAGQASVELERVDAVLAGTESVTASVDHASRIAQRLFANPVVKVLAWRAGAVGAMRRLREHDPAGSSEVQAARRPRPTGAPDLPAANAGPHRRIHIPATSGPRGRR